MSAGSTSSLSRAGVARAGAWSGLARPALLCAAAACLTPAAQAAPPFAVQKFQVSTGQLAATVAVEVIDVPAQATLRVVSAGELQGREAGRPPSVADLAATPGATLSQAIRRHAVLLVSGGYSSGDPRRPTGLLLSDGRMLSSPQYAKRPGEPKNSCPFLRVERFRLSGLVCRDAAGAVQLGSFTERGWAACRDGLQAGPVMVDAGRPALCPDNQDSYLRAALCQTRPRPQQPAMLRVAISLGPIGLHALAQWMAADPASGGLGCDSAVNLAGDSSAGAVLWQPMAGRSAAAPKPRLIGQGAYPLPSFLLFQLPR